MKIKLLVSVALICLIALFAGDCQAMTTIYDDGVACGVRVRHRVVRRVVPQVIITTVIRDDRHYRRYPPPPPPPPPRHRRCYR